MAAFDANTLLIGISLILLLIIAIKVLEMIMEVITVSVMSAAFYFVLALSFGFSTSLQDIGTFTVIGTSAYVFYKIAETLTSTASEILSVPFNIIKGLWNILRPFKRIKQLGGLIGSLGASSKGKKDQKSSDGDDEEDNVKSVVIDKVSGKDDED